MTENDGITLKKVCLLFEIVRGRISPWHALCWVQQERGLVPGLLSANRNPRMVSTVTEKANTAFWAPWISVIRPPHPSAENTQFCLECSWMMWTFIWHHRSVVSHLLRWYPTSWAMPVSSMLRAAIFPSKRPWVLLVHMAEWECDKLRQVEQVPVDSLEERGSECVTFRMGFGNSFYISLWASVVEDKNWNICPKLFQRSYLKLFLLKIAP